MLPSYSRGFLQWKMVAEVNEVCRGPQSAGSMRWMRWDRWTDSGTHPWTSSPWLFGMFHTLTQKYFSSFFSTTFFSCKELLAFRCRHPQTHRQVDTERHRDTCTHSHTDMCREFKWFWFVYGISSVTRFSFGVCWWNSFWYNISYIFENTHLLQ